ncbi:hypothetical protein QTO13_18385, partial [Vibrio parahaemolyticus]
KYDYLPLLTDVESYRQDLERHYTETGEDGSIESDMLEYLLDSFAKISAKNSQVNEERLGKMHRFYKWSLPSVGLFILASSLFIVADLDASSPRKPIVVQQISTTTTELKSPAELVPNKSGANEE